MCSFPLCFSHCTEVRQDCTLDYLKRQPLNLNTDVSTNNCLGFPSKLLIQGKGTEHLKAKKRSHTIQYVPSTSACWLHMWARLPTGPNPGSCLVQTGNQELNWKLIGNLHLPTDPQSVGPGDHREKWLTVHLFLYVCIKCDRTLWNFIHIFIP